MLIIDGKSFFIAESTNYGFGTVIARPVAIAGRVEQELLEFEEKLFEIIRR